VLAVFDLLGQGWIGSITGVNNHQMSIHEIGVSFPDASFGNESTVGVPFTYVLRDILQFDRTRMDGVSRLASAHRTCDLILGVGDGKDRRFNAVSGEREQTADENSHSLLPS
jgi:isopenicillin-N N-acyltransferase-like protein